MKKYALTIALLFPLVACGASLPRVEDARSAVAVARERQAQACLQLLRGPEWHERCQLASQGLRVAEAALRASQELETALAKEVAPDAGSR
jgi:hypothetical protein